MALLVLRGASRNSQEDRSIRVCPRAALSLALRCVPMIAAD